MLPAALVFQDDVERVDDARNVAEDGEEDVDAKVGSASTLKEYTQRGDEDGKEDLADVGTGSHSSGK